MLRTLITMVVSLLFGFILDIIFPQYGAIGCLVLFIALEGLPRVLWQCAESRRVKLEKILSEKLGSNLMLDHVFLGKGPFRFKSEVQPIYKVVEGLSKIKGRPYDEVWVILGDWYFGTLGYWFLKRKLLV